MTSQTTTTFPQYLDSFETMYRDAQRRSEIATREGLPTLAAHLEDEAAYWLAMWQGERRMAKKIAKAAEELGYTISREASALNKDSCRYSIVLANNLRIEAANYRSDLYQSIWMVCGGREPLRHRAGQWMADYC